jgi:hypothetical protein
VENSGLANRAPWYVHLVNNVGRLAASAGLRSDDALRPSAIMLAARRRAGGEDLGAPAVDDPLARLTRAMIDESAASQTGRLAMLTHLRDLLAARIRLNRAWATPGTTVTQEPVERPVFVFGLPRTGTTLLHNLLAQDPAVRVPWTWEVMVPTAVPGASTPQARRALAERQLRWVHRLAPAFRSVHAVDADLPQECIAITAYALQSIEFHTTHRVPSYQQWLEQTDQRPAYRWHRRFLQHLQADDRADAPPGPEGPRRWVLKAPGHLFAMEALLAEYPDAVLVQTHRDPLAVVGSISSHGVILREAFSDRVSRHEVALDWSTRWARALDRTLALRQRDPALEAKILDLHYDEVVADPLAAVAQIHRHAGLELSAAARSRMQAFMARNPQGRHGRHRYTLEQFGLEPAREQARFARYRDFLNA